MLRRWLLVAALAACAAPPEVPTPAAESAGSAVAEPLARVAERVPAAWRYPLESYAASSSVALLVSDAPLATQVGAAVLEAGGNAVDAAVATAFALAVVYPEAGNLGGGGFLVFRPALGTPAALDFREAAPLAATRTMFLDERGAVTDRSITGHLAAGVPGSVAGLWEAHRRYGIRRWAELLAPAIRLAEEGFTVDAEFAESVAGEAKRLAGFPASAALFLPGGKPLAAGSTWRNPELAAVLRRIAARGPAGFYEGETADLIVAEMRRGGGLITGEDLRRYRAHWREPVQFDYRGYRVISMPPPSSGGLTLALIANILEGYDLRAMGWHSADALHVTAEAMRRAFADRNHYLGDPDFVRIPRARLLSKGYAAERRASIALAQATPSSAISPGLGAGAEGEHTTHLSVVDAAGNAVALTTTINELYGSAVTVSGAGFLLNDEMDDFTAKPGTPNLYGLVQGEANAIAPGKRMLSAMTPTIVLGRNRQTLLITGARGGPRIITAVFQVLSNLVDHGLDLVAAVNTPRIHHQHLPDVLYYERDGLNAATVDSLTLRGHSVEARSGYIGSAPSLLRLGDHWVGVPDPRQGGLAAGPR
ncbi:MAG: gamma-glutamyltransferase [Gemmatimonadetes bacterium]|nr:gamma-glutamyltransferase [Gemmatimonadota bacterium]